MWLSRYHDMSTQISASDTCKGGGICATQTIDFFLTLELQLRTCVRPICSSSGLAYSWTEAKIQIFMNFSHSNLVVGFQTDFGLWSSHNRTYGIACVMYFARSFDFRKSNRANAVLNCIETKCARMVHNSFAAPLLRSESMSMQGVVQRHLGLPHRKNVNCFKTAQGARTSRKRPRATVSEQHAQPSDNPGNSGVQEKLMDIIRVQIGQEKVKDFVNLESEKLRQAAEEVCFRLLDCCQTAEPSFSTPYMCFKAPDHYVCSG